MAEALGITGSAITVVELSAKIAKLCVQYSTEVTNARADIDRLHSQVEQLGTILQDAQRLTDDTKAQSLFTSRGLNSSFCNCITELRRLEKKLGPSPARIAMRRLGRRALKWPFSSKEVAQILTSLERHEKTILLGLQIDQTNVLLDIQDGVKQLGLQSTEDALISRKPHYIVPFPPNPDFIHRPEIEQWIRDQYCQPGQRMALVGMGGFGKSQLAIDFANYVHRNKPGTSVFWVHGNSRATFEESYRALADILLLPRQHEPNMNVLALVRDWLQNDDMSPWLMVLDNADDISVFDKRHGDAMLSPIASYLPKSILGKILVTSRSLNAADKLVGNSRAIVQIPVIGEDQALELFWNKVESKTDKAAAADLVLALNCIPLAVSQAAAYINRRSPRVTITSYLHEFRKSSKRKDSLLRSDRGDLGRYDVVSNSVVVTWQVTFEQIQRERPGAANLLSLMSQFQAQNIPENMLHGYNGDITQDSNDLETTNTGSSSDGDGVTGDLEDDMDVLRGYSLVAASTAGFCEMHSLVQYCTRSWILEFGDPTRWSQLFMELAADHFPFGALENWGTCQSLLSHVEPLLSRSPRGQDCLLQWAELLTNVSSYMLMIGEHLRSEVLVKQAIQTRTSILGPDHPLTLKSMGGLASAYRDQGRLEEAEKLQVEVMKTRKIKLGAEHPSILTSMSHLASTYSDQGRWEEAEKLAVEVMKTLKAKLGADHPSTLASIGNLAFTWQHQGRLKEAEMLQVEVMETSKANLGADHPFTLVSIGNLAFTWQHQGRLEEAEMLQVEVMKTSKARIGADHPSTLTSMGNLASIYRNQGRCEEAEMLQVEVMKTRKTKLGADHPDTLTSMGNLAFTYGAQGRWEEAEKLEVEVMETRKAKLGADHPDTLATMGNLAITFSKQGRWEEAEKLLVEVIEARKAKLGVDHPDTLVSMANLAFTWQAQGRQEKALSLMQDCADLRRKKLGHNHPHTQSSVATLQSWQACASQ